MNLNEYLTNHESGPLMAAMEFVRIGEYEYNEREKVVAGMSDVAPLPYSEVMTGIIPSLVKIQGMDIGTTLDTFLSFASNGHPDAVDYFKGGLRSVMGDMSHDGMSDDVLTINKYVQQDANTRTLINLIGMYLRGDEKEVENVEEENAITGFSSGSEADLVVDGVHLHEDTSLMAGEITGGGAGGQAFPFLRKNELRYDIHDGVTAELLPNYQGYVRDGNLSNLIYTAIDEKGERSFDFVSLADLPRLTHTAACTTINDVSTGEPLVDYQGLVVDYVGGASQYCVASMDYDGKYDYKPVTVMEAQEIKAGLRPSGVPDQAIEVGEIAQVGGTPSSVPERRPEEVVRLAGVMLVRDEESNYRRPGEDKVVLIDKGNSIKIGEGKKDIIKASLALAAEKGWTEINVTGTGRFKSEMWLQASLAGLKVNGYTPSARDMEAFHAANTKTSGLEERAASHEDIMNQCVKLNVGATEANKSAWGPYRGEVMAESAHHFAQNSGKGHYVVHEKTGAHPVKVGDKLEVKYSGGQQIVTDVSRKGQEAGREGR